MNIDIRHVVNMSIQVHFIIIEECPLDFNSVIIIHILHVSYIDEVNYL